MFFCSCLPHIVNLACKAALAAITILSYAADTVEGYEDYEPTLYTHRDCIATIRSLVNTVGVFDFLHIIVIYNNVGRFATVISRNSCEAHAGARPQRFVSSSLGELAGIPDMY